MFRERSSTDIGRFFASGPGPSSSAGGVSSSALPKDIPADGTTVREWLLNRNPSSFDILDSYRVFGRVLGEMERRHAAGVWGHLRPSCIRLNSSGSVSIAPSTPKMSPLPSPAEAEQFPPPELVLGPPEDDEPLERWRKWEDRWYIPPILSSKDQARRNGLPTHGDATDDLFCLGMLLLELLWPFDAALGEVGRAKRLDSAAQRILPVDTLQKHPREVALALSLLHPDPAERPSVRDLLSNSVVMSFFACFQDTGRYESELAGQEETAEVLLAALDPVLREVEGEREALSNEIHLLTAALDGLEARLQQSNTATAGPSSQPQQLQGPGAESEGDDAAMASPRGEPPAAKKRRTEPDAKAAHDEELAEAMWSRVQDHLEDFDRVAMERLSPLFTPPAPSASGPPAPPKANGEPAPPPASNNLPLVSRPSNLQRTSSALQAAPSASPHGLLPVGAVMELGTDMGKFARYSQFEVLAQLRNGDYLDSFDLVSSIAFSRDDKFFATAGVSKRIKIFELSGILDQNMHFHYPVAELVTRSKLTSVCWNPYLRTHVACGDYDGTVQIWDANSNSQVMELDEHNQRVWSVDFCSTDPTRLASGSDDGAVRLWDTRDDRSVLAVPTKASVCSVHFNPASANQVAVGSASSKAFLYDLRRPSLPLAVMQGHERAVSYVKFVDGRDLVTMAADSTLRLWPVAALSGAQIAPPAPQDATGGAPNSSAVAAGTAGGGNPWDTGSVNVSVSRVFKGHRNEKHFVGLGVRPDGYILAGSEDNDVFLYHTSFHRPALARSIEVPAQHGTPVPGERPAFTTAVCWSGKGNLALVANSVGCIEVLQPGAASGDAEGAA